ncbi:MAG: glycosyltransferase family 2 protein [Gemmataceae bacterium]|nr:glycosyltransferase family 2 protein [Gemmataceae bacterium]
MNILVAIPVFNEERHVAAVLRQVRKFTSKIVVIDDGSTDDTSAILAKEKSIERISHPVNRGYGAALISAFEFAIEQGVDALITMDCDGQHEPERIPVLGEAIGDCDIASASRYLRDFHQDTHTPEDRKQINSLITREINLRYGLQITDAFCGFKAYRTSALRQLVIKECGWGMPLEVWVQAASLGLRIREVAVPRIYLDPSRAFGGMLNDSTSRLAYYRQVLLEAEERAAWPKGHPCSPFTFDHLLSIGSSR